MKEEQEGFAAFLKRRYQGRSTPKHYLSDLRQFLLHVGDKQPQQVTMQDVDGFVDDQVGRGLRPTTINRRLASIHAFFEYLADSDPDQEQPNPVKWRRHRIKTGERLPRDASDSDVAAVFAQIDDVRDQALFGLLIGAGLRVGEVVALRCEDLMAPTVVTECARLRVRGKGQKERIVWVTPRWYMPIQNWLACRPTSDWPQLFLNQHQRPLSVSGVQYRWRGYCQAANVHITCHQLRHTFARRLAEQGMPTESIAELLGHSQVTTTQRYTAGANVDLRDEFLAAMNAIETPEPTETDSPVAFPRPPRQQRLADPAILTAALDQLADLPAWLSPTLQRYFRHRWQRWQPHMVSRIAPTVAGRMRRLWRWLVVQREVSDWHELKRRDVEAWVTKRQADGVSAKTIRNDLALLKSCVRFAEEEGLPIAAGVLRVKPPAQPRPVARYLTTEQMQHLLATVSEATTDHPLERAWFLTLAHTGIRCGELLNLRLADLDLATRRLFVATGKNGAERIVYLTSSLSASLAAYLTIRPSSSSDGLWLHPDGSPLTYSQVNTQLGKWGKACDVPVTAHRLRHTFATQLVNHGMPLQAVARLLGHQSLNMAQHYARLFEHTVKAQFVTAVAQIEGYLASDWPWPNPLIDNDEQYLQLADSV